MQQIKFLYGRNLAERQKDEDVTKHIPFTAGVIYFDTATGEMFYDAPDVEDATSGAHTKVIDTATLIYTITESISFPSSGGSGGDNDSGSTSAKLGVAILGSMKLG